MSSSLRIAGGLILGALVTSVHAADAVYYFLDEDGVPHFSNVPADFRYKSLAATGPATTLPTTERLPPPGRPAPAQLLPEPTPLAPEPAAAEPEPTIPTSDR